MRWLYNGICVIVFLMPCVTFSQCACLEDIAMIPTCVDGSCGNGRKNGCLAAGDFWYSAPDGGTDECEDDLPVELLSFTAMVVSNRVKLDWTTASEINNDRFEVYRSKDGVEWELLDTVSGAGNSVNLIKYTYYDVTPDSGVAYYRLLQVDFDGTSTYSHIATVGGLAGGLLDHKQVKVTVFPNPATVNSRIYLKFENFINQKEILVVIRNNLGQEIYSKMIVLGGQGNVFALLKGEGKLSAGFYHVTGYSTNKLFSKKLLVR